jgi:hypothetical protein
MGTGLAKSTASFSSDTTIGVDADNARLLLDQSNCCAADSLLPASPDPEDQIAGLCLVGPTPVGPRSKEYGKQF